MNDDDEQQQTSAGSGPDDDYYALLNVSRKATIDEINRAFRQRSRIFHPDRHMSDELKKSAEAFFVKLQLAHETLVDPAKRAIYDAVGVRGLDVAGWELSIRSENADHIRREYEFLRRLYESEVMMQHVQPSGQFVIKTDAVDMFRTNPLDRKSPELVKIAISQTIDCPLTPTDNVALSGRVQTKQGTGSGAFAFTWHRSISSIFSVETQVSFEDTLSTSFKLATSYFKKTIIAIQPSFVFQFDANRWSQLIEPQISFHFDRQLNSFWLGTIAINIGANSNITTSIVHTEFNQPKFVAQLTLSTRSLFLLRLVYTHRHVENDTFYQSALSLFDFGAITTFTFERKLTKYSRIGCSLTTVLPNGALNIKFRLKRGSFAYDYELALCNCQSELPRTTLYVVIIPLIIFQIVKRLFRPMIDSFMTIFDDNTNRLPYEIDRVRKEEAIRAIDLMRHTAKRIRDDEEMKGGLVIIDAQYGQMINDSSDDQLHGAYYANDRTIDVTIPLQSMVADSQLIIYASVKSELPGFYDPCPGEEKMLRVRYRFDGRLHAVAVAAERPLRIPHQSHRID